MVERERELVLYGWERMHPVPEKPETTYISYT
jgi:hypothetical protein